MSTTAATPVSRIGVGIDSARFGHRVTFLRDDKQPAARPLTVKESRSSYQELSQVLQQLHEKYPQASFHVHIDAAGQYTANLEHFLRSLDLPKVISIGEPKRNKDYHRAVSPKRNADDTESYAMARFGVVEQPTPTEPVPPAFYALREIAARLQGQVRDSTRALNRLHNLLARVFPELSNFVSDLSARWVLTLLHSYPTPQRIAAARLSSLQKIPYLRAEKAAAIRQAAMDSVGSLQDETAESLIRHCVEQVQNCVRAEKALEELLLRAYRNLPPSGHIHLESISGIGAVTAAVLVAKMISISRFATAEHVVGYFGVFPEENSSGVDRYGLPKRPGSMRMSCKGSDLVRRYLWNAAKSAIQTNPAVAELYARLRAKGTRGDVALGHCMRKLLHQVFGVWASEKPFDENYERPRTAQISPHPATADDSASTKAETAAGHKRENPQSKVVTAASSTVDPTPPAVNAAHGSIDYDFVREQVTMEQILRHVGHFDRLQGKGAERRGPCPLHGSRRPGSRSFAVNLERNVYHCFHHGCTQGNVLDFWQAFHQLPLYEATCHLVNTFQLQIQREQRRGARNLPQRP
jgi:transposase